MSGTVTRQTLNPKPVLQALVDFREKAVFRVVAQNPEPQIPFIVSRQFWLIANRKLVHLSEVFIYVV